MTDKPDPSLFSVNERDGEYEAVFGVEGKLYHSIKADSLADAKAQAEALADDQEGVLDIGDIDDVEIEINRVRKLPPLYRVTREGKPMQVSRLEAGDLPREPDERGF